MPRHLILAATLAVFMGALPADAQSTADLQTIGQAAAAQYGVPWQLFKDQIQAESSWRANPGCVGPYNACGIAQFIPETAKTYGVNTSDPTSSLYGAAAYDAKLYQQTGSWTGALTKYSGGLTPASPGTGGYPTVFADAQALDASGTTLSSGGLGAGASANTTAPLIDTIGTGSLNDAAAIGSGMDALVALVLTPFSSAYSLVSDVALTKITAATANTMGMATSLFAILLVLAYMLKGLQVWYSRATFEQIGWFTLRVGIVAPFVLGSYWFNAVFVQLISIDTPRWIANNLGTGQGAAANPAVPYDAAVLNFVQILATISRAGAWYDLMLPIILGLCLLFMMVVLALMFAPFILLTAAMDFVVLLIPILLLGVPFEATRKYFGAAMNIIVFILLGYVFVDVVTQIFVSDIAHQLATIPKNAGAWKAAVALVMVVIHVMLIGLLLPVGWYIAKTIGNAAGVPISIPTPMSVVQRGLRWV